MFWIDYFKGNASSLFIDWTLSAALTPAEAEAIGRSVAQFQLGEGSEGKHFLWLAKSKGAEFHTALALFIAEEHSHSRMLAGFLQRAGLPLLQADGVDSIFRGLRKLAGLELCVAVLVTAECIAVPYYTALRDATGSALLRAICHRILQDEAAHLLFQGETLARLRHHRAAFPQMLCRRLHLLFLLLTCCVVWHQHAAVFRLAGFRFSMLWRQSARELRRCLAATYLAKPLLGRTWSGPALD